MQKLLREYLDERNTKRRKNLKAGVAMLLLAVMVIGCVAGALSQYGIAMTGNVKCGQEAHQHGPECYAKELVCNREEGEGHTHSDECRSTEQVLICGEEEGEDHTHTDACYETRETYVCGEEEREAHFHTDACYEEKFICEKNEHIHTDACYSDAAVDVETENVWENQYAQTQWTGIWGEDLVLAAQAQLGYKESIENFIVAEDGSRKGYTRYGAFVNDSYCNWDAAFVSFCLHYAGIQNRDTETPVFPKVTDTAKWQEEFEKLREGNSAFFTGPEGYVPAAGDLVFFQRENEETAVQMGIVASFDQEKNEIHVIEGNSQNEVKENIYSLNELNEAGEVNDPHIISYLKLTEVETAYKAEQEAADSQNPEEPDNSGEHGPIFTTEGQEPDETEEATVELTTKVDGTTITLSGPQSSFEEGKGYSIQATKVEDEKVIATIEKAIEPLEDPNAEPIATAEKAETKAQEEEPAAAPAETGAPEEAPTEAPEETTAAPEETPAAESGETTAPAAEEPTAAPAETTGAAEEPTAEPEEAAALEEPQAIAEEPTEAPTAEGEETEQPTKQIKSYQAFDIKLMADGEEVQPLGPVSVKFSSQEVTESVEDEATEVKVIHVDETTGAATDMEAAATEEKDVVIETEHFSVYVYVKLGNIFGTAKVTVQHWGRSILTIKGTADASNPVEDEKNVYTTGHTTINTEKKDREIYSTDTLTIPHTHYAKVTDLSKVCKVGTESMNYKVSEVWVSTDMTNEKKEKWPEGTYKSYSLLEENSSTDTEIEISQDSLIRFWYLPKESDDKHPVHLTDGEFYDYDITDGVKNRYYRGTVTAKGGLNIRSGGSSTFKKVGFLAEGEEFVVDKEGTASSGWYKIISHNGEVGGYISNYLAYTTIDWSKSFLKADRQGINANGNYTGEDESQRIGVGQRSSGNRSSWANLYATSRAQYNGKNLNSGNGNNGFNIVTGIANAKLSGGNLQYNVANPNNYLFTQGNGSTKYTWPLGFKQNGDTFTLQQVNNQGNDLTKITSRLFGEGTANRRYISSNDFWPLDQVTNADPHLGARTTNEKYGYLEQQNGSWVVSHVEGPTSGAVSNSGTSDDFLDHNWHFGMTYAVEFTVGDYTGPMEYYFRGDDDFWLYVDDQLLVDIGGIHSSVGQSLDLRAEMVKRGLLEYDGEGNLLNKDAPHTLKVFYMERGGFGSCCYMQFTLPKSAPVEVEPPETTKYEVEKKWSDGENFYRPDHIEVRLVQKDPQGNVIGYSAPVELNAANGWKKTWTGLPIKKGKKEGTEFEYSYEVEEINLPEGYTSELVDGVLTNTLNPIKIKVKKDWLNDTGMEKYRPTSVRLQLYTYDQAQKTYTPYLDRKGNPKYVDLTPEKWEGEISNLPRYSYTWDATSKTWKGVEINYCVREVYEGADGKWKPVEEGNSIAGNGASYKVSYSKDGTDWSSASADENNPTTFTVTNTLLTKFRIVKKGKGGGEAVTLQGAQFTLSEYTSAGEEKDVLYDGVSGEDGVVLWTKKNDNSVESAETVAMGRYLLRETGAPDGYLLNTEEWIIDVDEFGMSTVSKKDGTDGVNVQESVDASGKVIFTYTFVNTLFYQLPSTGGLGIYWSTLCGVLLMAAASLIVYRNKRKEVL